jgi:hypothetical protein
LYEDVAVIGLKKPKPQLSLNHAPALPKASSPIPVPRPISFIKDQRQTPATLSRVTIPA